MVWIEIIAQFEIVQFFRNPRIKNSKFISWFTFDTKLIYSKHSNRQLDRLFWFDAPNQEIQYTKIFFYVVTNWRMHKFNSSKTGASIGPTAYKLLNAPVSQFTNWRKHQFNNSQTGECTSSLPYKLVNSEVPQLTNLWMHKFHILLTYERTSSKAYKLMNAQVQQLMSMWTLKFNSLVRIPVQS